MLVFLCAACAAANLIQTRVFDHTNRIRVFKQALFYLPSTRTLELMSLGFDQALADYFWIKVLTYKELGLKSDERPDVYAVFEDAEEVERLKKLQKERLLRFMELAVHFDPKFIEVYEYAGAILPWQGDLETADRLLEAGLKKNPGVWRIPYLLAFNRYFFDQDYDAAMKYFTIAGRISGAPALGSRAAAMSMMKDDPETALKTLYAFYSSARDAQTREFYAEKIMYFKLEKNIRDMNWALWEYEKRLGKRCEDLNDLVKAGLLKGIPKEPFGGEFVIDGDKYVVDNKPHNRLQFMVDFMDRKYGWGERK